MASINLRKYFNRFLDNTFQASIEKRVEELANQRVGSYTSLETLQSLIQKIHPVATDKELIRLGPKGDGGYLVPNDLEGIGVCLSPGVGPESRFEKSCLERGMQVFMADASVEKPKQNHSEFHFLKKFIGIINSGDYITMDSWAQSCIQPAQKQDDFLLQMDIEGAEYLVLANISEQLLQRCRIIVVEFHQLQRLWSEDFFRVAAAVFEKLLQSHTCVHIHPNNHQKVEVKDGIAIPKVAEFTFFRNDRITSRAWQTNFPNPLDADNYTYKPPVVLPDDWFRNSEN